MAALFKAWRQRYLGRFLLRWFRGGPPRGLTTAMGLENPESDHSGDEFRRVSRDNPLLVGGYYADVNPAVGRRNY